MVGGGARSNQQHAFAPTHHLCSFTPPPCCPEEELQQIGRRKRRAKALAAGMDEDMYDAQVGRRGGFWFSGVCMHA